MRILLIEDDLDDIELLQESLTSRKILFSMETLNDGAAAIDYLRDSNSYPDIIVLDLNLPKVHGKEIMREIKSQSGFKNIPVLVLTTSSAAQDRQFASDHGADGYVVKPTDSEQFNALVKTILQLADRNPSLH
jgi:DNA-binding response OmpR family regulator